MELLELPFQFLRIPNLRLKLPKIPYPSAMTVFALVFVSYFLVLSGVIYDVIVEPPSIGSSQEGDAVKPIVFLQYRVNGQFIIEGLAAGLLFGMGGFGFIILDRANQKFTTSRNRFLLLLSGILCVFVAYNLCIVFLKMKLPNYMR